MAAVIKGNYTNPNRIVIDHDFETFCRLSIFTVGGWRYAEDESCEPLMLSWGHTENDIETWLPLYQKNGQTRLRPLPKNFLDHIRNPDVMLQAHNAEFEYAVWNYCVRRLWPDAPEIHASRYICTAIRCAASGLPRSLDGAGRALGLATLKDKEGTRLLNIFSKMQAPKKPTKANPAGVPERRIMPWDQPEEFDNLIAYNITDVKAEMLIPPAVPALSAKEQRFFTMTLEMNRRGLPLDMEAVVNSMPTLTELERRVERRVVKLTGGVKPTQRDKMIEVFNDLGENLENLQAKTLKDILTIRGDDLDADVKELMLLRLEGGKASTKKLKKMLQIVSPNDGRVRGGFVPFGAHTGRYCIAENERVQVRGKGAIPIQQVQAGDNVWDGSAWVACDGAIFSGVKQTTLRHGVNATYDHQVWLDPNTKVPLGKAGAIWVSLPPGVAAVPNRPGIAIAGYVPTWDILNAGPNNRFALADGSIVSNSARGIQPQNFPRGNYEPSQLEDIFWMLINENADTFELLFRRPIDAVAQAMRGYIKPAAGNRFIVSDFAAIEARILAWLAGEESMLEIYRKNGDVYVRMAAALYKTPEAELLRLKKLGDKGAAAMRFMGKTIVLGCGFQMGGAGFYRNCILKGIKVEEAFCMQAVKTYRKEVPNIVQMWYDVEECAIDAVVRHATKQNPVVLRNLRFYMRGRWLCIELPSGRPIRYFEPKVQRVERFGRMAPQLSFRTEVKGKLIRESSYGGKLTENIVQAVARDVMVESMYRAGQRGYNVVATIHDELVCEVPLDFGSAKELEDLMSELPDWAAGAPVSCEGWADQRYRK